MVRPVNALMGERCVVELRIDEGFKGRHLNAIGVDPITGRAATGLDPGTGGFEEGLGALIAFIGIRFA